jgi:hypothetical protein
MAGASQCYKREQARVMNIYAKEKTGLRGAPALCGYNAVGGGTSLRTSGTPEFGDALLHPLSAQGAVDKIKVLTLQYAKGMDRVISRFTAGVEDTTELSLIRLVSNKVRQA